LSGKCVDFTAASGKRLPVKRQNLATEYLDEHIFLLKKGKTLI